IRLVRRTTIKRPSPQPTLKLLNRNIGGITMGKKIVLGLLVCLLACSLTAIAQETTGGIQGTVKDPQGAVVPGATVEVTSPALLGKKTAITDAGGYCHFEQLPPGLYSITASTPGFGPSTQANLQLKTV